MSFALIIALSFTLPIAIVVFINHATIAPLNYLSGCCAWKPVATDAVYNPVSSDVTDFVLPDRFEVKTAYSHHQIALWNPSYFGGEVFLANLQSTVLHPVNLFYLVTNELNVQTISVLLSLFLTVFFMALFLMELGRSRPAAALGAIALGGSTFVIFWATFGMMTWMIAGIPMSLMLLLKWYKTKTPKWLGLLTFGLGIQWFFGHIQFSFLVYVIVALFALYYFIFETGRNKAAMKDLVYVGAALLGGFLLGCAQLLPFLEQAKIGHRDGLAYASHVANLAQVKIDLQNFISPYIFQGKPQTHQYLFSYGPFRFSIGLIPGILSLLAIVAGIIKFKTQRRILFFGFLFIGGMLWMWGSLPEQFLGLISNKFKALNPRYFMALPIFSASVLAAYGLDTVNEFLTSHSRKIKAYFFRKKILFWLAILYGTGLWAIHVILHQHNIAKSNQLLLAAYISSLAIVLLTVPLNRKYLKPILFLPFLAVLAEALLVFTTTQPLPPKSLYYSGNPYFEYVIKDSGQPNPANVRIISPFSPQTNLYYGLSTLNGYDSLYAKRTVDLIHAINYPQKTFELSASSRNAIYIGNLNKTPLLQNLGVEYAIDRPAQQLSGWREVYSNIDSGWSVYKSVMPAAEVYFANGTISLDETSQLDAVKYNKLEYRQVAFYGGAPRGVAPAAPTDVIKYDIDINKINVHTTTSGKRVLFLAQTYRKQWKAYVDGSPVKVYRADYNFMGVVVPDGSHHISLVYDPASFKIGVAISTITAIGLLGYTISVTEMRIINPLSLWSKKPRTTNGKKR